MPRSISRTDEAFQDTLIHKASGFAVDDLAALYGLRRPANWPTEDWTNVMRSIVFAVKGSYGSMLSMFTELFRPWARRAEVSCRITNTGTISRIGLFVSFPSYFVGGRLAEIERSNGERHVVAINRRDQVLGTTLYIEPGGSYSANYPIEGVTSETATIRLLPFIFKETQENRVYGTHARSVRYPQGRALFQVLLDSSLLSVPSTYMTERAEIRQVAPTVSPPASIDADNIPFGGIILTLTAESADQRYRNETSGPFPLYLFGEDASGLLSFLLRYVLVAGVRGEIRLTKLGPAVNWGEF